MTPANQHTGIERLSDERLRHLLAQLPSDEFAGVPRTWVMPVAFLREILTGYLSLRAPAEPEPVRAALAHLLAEMLDLADDEMAQPITSDILVNPYEAADHIISTLFASSSAVDGVTVKPLEWEGSDAARMWYANSAFGYYDVARDGDVWRFGCGSLVVGRNFSTSDNAKRAAFFDYEQRILSALAGGSNGRP